MLLNPKEMFLRPKLCKYLFGNGTLDDALRVMAAFDSAMDEPVMLIPGCFKSWRCDETLRRASALSTIQHSHSNECFFLPFLCILVDMFILI